MIHRKIIHHTLFIMKWHKTLRYMGAGINSGYWNPLLENWTGRAGKLMRWKMFVFWIYSVLKHETNFARVKLHLYNWKIRFWRNTVEEIVSIHKKNDVMYLIIFAHIFFDHFLLYITQWNYIRKTHIYNWNILW